VCVKSPMQHEAYEREQKSLTEEEEEEEGKSEDKIDREAFKDEAECDKDDVSEVDDSSED
jgi:hypothetical protein